FCSSRRRHTRSKRDWSSDVCSSDLRDTGESINEMQRGVPETISCKRRVMIYWEGPKNRKNIIHLNEHGYTRDGKKYTPKGYAVIAKTLEAGELKYRSIIRREMTK